MPGIVYFLQEAFLEWAVLRVTFSLLLLLPSPEHILGGWEVAQFRRKRVPL